MNSGQVILSAMRSLKRFSKQGTALSVALILSTTAQAAIITTLYNTGVDASGNVVASGNDDLHWNITESVDPSFLAPDAAIVQQANNA